jgi:ribosomal protein S26
MKKLIISKNCKTSVAKDKALKRKILEKKLANESELVRMESIAVLKEFEAVYLDNK